MLNVLRIYPQRYNLSQLAGNCLPAVRRRHRYPQCGLQVRGRSSWPANFCANFAPLDHWTPIWSTGALGPPNLGANMTSP